MLLVFLDIDIAEHKILDCVFPQELITKQFPESGFNKQKIFLCLGRHVREFQIRDRHIAPDDLKGLINFAGLKAGHKFIG